MSIDSILFELDHASLHICGKYIMVFPGHDTSKLGVELCTVDEMFRMLEAAENIKEGAEK